jgi:hypothetical protein
MSTGSGMPRKQLATKAARKSVPFVPMDLSALLSPEDREEPVVKITLPSHASQVGSFTLEDIGQDFDNCDTEGAARLKKKRRRDPINWFVAEQQQTSVSTTNEAKAHHAKLQAGITDLMSPKSFRLCNGATSEALIRLAKEMAEKAKELEKAAYDIEEDKKNQQKLQLPTVLECVLDRYVQ